MAGEKRAAGQKDSVTGRKTAAPGRGSGYRNAMTPAGTSPDTVHGQFFRDHALSLIIFCMAFFFIVTITNPGLYINDEWITANQLHQLDIGHQVTFSEGKYGTLENGTATAYFASRQNVLMYSLALPLLALPLVKIFSIFGDNFRLLIILLWSASLVAAALLMDTYYPRYFRRGNLRLLYPVMFLSLILFMVNVLLYKQFPFSAPDAPFEVAALVLANHLLFALTATLVFEICRRVMAPLSLALIGTAAVISCSSFLFWAGTGKDHMLTATVFTCVMFLFVRYLSGGKPKDATLSFVFCGLLVWVRPEVGFFVTIFAGIFFALPYLTLALKNPGTLVRTFLSLFPLTGAFIGGIPFFVNNLLTSNNWLIPVFDLPRNLAEPGKIASAGSAAITNITPSPVIITQTDNLNLPSTLLRAGDLISHAMFSGFSFDNIVRGFAGVMLFPANGHIGFVIICPLVVIALIAFCLWNRNILEMNEKQKILSFFFLVMGIAAIVAYLPKLGAMNISSGILPDMRYLSPAYIPFGILSIMVLSRTPLIRKPEQMLQRGVLAGIILAPVLLVLMIAVHPFGSVNEGYTLFFEVLIVLELALCSVLMVVSRFVLPENRLLIRSLPVMLILIVISVFTFQLVLVFIFGVIVKVNGYPLWIPLVREGFKMFFNVTVMPPG
jgi:hypothetical protein